MIQNHIKGIAKNEADEKIDRLLSHGHPKFVEFLIHNRDKHIANLIFQKYDITAITYFEFIGMLQILIIHQQFGLIKKYIDHRHTNNLHEKDDQFYYRGIIDALTFNNDEEKQTVKSLLKI